MFLPMNFQAQDISSILFSGYSTDYFGQLTDKKIKEGMGFQRLKDGNLYAGDMRNNKFHGFGVMISGEGGKIANCSESYVYVGEWENGKKKGNGTIYGRNGSVIYIGKFENDTPTGTYPSDDIDSSMCFTFLELEEDEEKELYIGEIANGKPQGYGLKFYEDGVISLAPYKDGVVDGLGIMIIRPNYWSTFRVKNGKWFKMSTSREQLERITNNKEVAARERNELIQTLNRLLYASTQMIEKIDQVKNGDLTNINQSYSSTDNNYDMPIGLSSSSGGSYQSQYSNWERVAQHHYQSLTNLGYSHTNKDGNKKGGTLQSMSGNNYVRMKKNFREAQKEMQRIRREAAKKGVNIPISKWENATISY